MDLAIERYSQDRPREIVATASGDGSATDFALPTGWVDGMSRLVSVEYPFPPTSGQREPNTIYNANERNAPERVRVVQATSSAQKIRFMDLTPVTGTNNILFIFTGLHTVHATTAASTTVFASDESAIALLVASYACEMVASKYAETKDAAISVDSVDFRSRSREYADRAKALLKLYLGRISGDKDGAQRPADGIVDWDVNLVSGRDRLFRRGRLV